MMFTINEKLMKRNVGYANARDEYQKSVIVKFLAQCTVISFYLLLTACFISLISDVLFKRLSIATPLLFMLLLFVFMYIFTLSNRLVKTMHSQYVEVYDASQYNLFIKSLKLKSLHIFIFLVLSSLIYELYIGHLFFEKPIILDLFDVLGAVAQASILTVSLYFLGKLMMSRKF